MSSNLLTISEVAEKLNATQVSLRAWDRQGKLVPIRTPGGHRRYKAEDVDKFMGILPQIASKVESVAVYARVSSHEQKAQGDLERQKNRLVEHCAKSGYKVDHILEDVGSGMSDNRPKMKALFKLVIEKKIGKVVVEYKDRMTRFQFNVFAEFFGSHGVSIEVIGSPEDKTYEQELVDDIMALMASFSGKIYGKRSADRRKKAKALKQLVAKVA